MAMSRDEALRALGLEASVTPADVESKLLEKLTPLEARIATAPTDALREKYRRQLADLEEARTTLLGGMGGGPTGLSRTKMADLPVSQAGFTGDGRAANGMGVLLQPGTLLAGRYEIAEQVGAGGMGAVYRAFDRNRGKDIAIKVLLPSLLSSPRARERFMAEARLSSELSHPAIVNVFDVQQDGPHCFLTMELLRGRSLRAWMAELLHARQPMPLAEALAVARDVCDGLAHAHARTVHRDIKPENIWIGEDGSAKVMDFGIAQLLEHSGTEAESGATGTAYYMPPEQIAGAPNIDGRADQYAVGATLYEMLAGHVPTGRIESLRRLRTDVPASVSNAVDRALSPKAADRFPDIGSFRAALEPSRTNALRAHAPILAIAGGVAGLVLLVALAWPAMRELIPDRAAEAKSRGDSARLHGEAKSLLRVVEAQKQELKEAVTAATRDVERLDAQQRSARTPDERRQVLPEVLAAQQAAAMHVQVERSFRSLLDGPDGMPTVEGMLSVAESALKNGELPQAVNTFQQAVDRLKQLQAAPARLRTDAAKAQEQAMQTLAGRWTVQGCESASSWSVEGGQLRVTWPQVGDFEARVLHGGGGAFTAQVTRPESQKGRLYRYHINGNRLDVEDLTQNRRATLSRC
jgi:hypothetical protein